MSREPKKLKHGESPDGKKKGRKRAAQIQAYFEKQKTGLNFGDPNRPRTLKEAFKESTRG